MKHVWRVSGAQKPEFDRPCPARGPRPRWLGPSGRSVRARRGFGGVTGFQQRARNANRGNAPWTLRARLRATRTCSVWRSGAIGPRPELRLTTGVGLPDGRSAQGRSLSRGRTRAGRPWRPVYAAQHGLRASGAQRICPSASLRGRSDSVEASGSLPGV
jgi:hypothetical protein